MGNPIKLLTLSLPLLMALLPPQMLGQLRAGCTADSLTVLMAGSLSVAGVWRYSCYAQNIGTTPQTLSVAGFALDFIELQQVAPGDVLDIFTQKQARTTPARIALVAEIAGVAALAVLSQNYVALSAKAIGDVGFAAYGAAKAGQYFTTKIPPLTNAVRGLLTQDQIIQPGGSYAWKLYASNNVPVPVTPLLEGRRKMLRPVRPVIPVRTLTQASGPAAQPQPTTWQPRYQDSEGSTIPALHTVNAVDTVASWEPTSVEWVGSSR
jgi:hypothetical protein